MYFLLPVSLAFADPIADLAPGPAELGGAQTELDERLVVAEAIERAVARLQSTYAVTPATDELCNDVLRGPLVVKLRAFATAWHDAAQRVRTQAARVQRISQANTVLPIIDTDRKRAIDDLLKRSREQEAAWLEFVSWMNQERPGVCGLDLEPGRGLPDPLVHGEGEERGAVAVLTLGSGYVCAGGSPSRDGVPITKQVVVVQGPVCWSAEPACDCKPEEQDPAAVLGP